jgi:hypothetical protein
MDRRRVLPMSGVRYHCRSMATWDTGVPGTRRGGAALCSAASFHQWCRAKQLSSRYDSSSVGISARTRPKGQSIRAEVCPTQRQCSSSSRSLHQSRGGKVDVSLLPATQFAHQSNRSAPRSACKLPPRSTYVCHNVWGEACQATTAPELHPQPRMETEDLECLRLGDALA